MATGIAFNGMPMPPFVKGFNNPKFHAQLVEVTGKAIDDAAAFGCPSVIVFNGYKWRDPEDPNERRDSLEEGAKTACRPEVADETSEKEKSDAFAWRC